MLGRKMQSVTLRNTSLDRVSESELKWNNVADNVETVDQECQEENPLD